MKHENFPLFVLFIATICLGLGCAQTSKQGFSGEAVGARDSLENRERIDPILLKKVSSLYPRIQLQPAETVAFFSIVREVFRVPVDDATERLMVEVRWVVPGLSARGAGAFLLFKDAEDEVPISKVWTHAVAPGDDVLLVENQWVRFGNGPLVSLLEDESMRNLSWAVGNYLAVLARGAASGALNVYLNEGLSAFLKLAPIRARAPSEGAVRPLPGQASQVVMYPSRVEDFRSAGFRYSSAWDGSVLVRVTPADPTQDAVVLEMGAQGRGEGIAITDVELFVVDVRPGKPTDRPAPEEELLPATVR